MRACSHGRHRLQRRRVCSRATSRRLVVQDRADLSRRLQLPLQCLQLLLESSSPDLDIVGRAIPHTRREDHDQERRRGQRRAVEEDRRRQRTDNGVDHLQQHEGGFTNALRHLAEQVCDSSFALAQRRVGIDALARSNLAPLADADEDVVGPLPDGIKHQIEHKSCPGVELGQVAHGRIASFRPRARREMSNRRENKGGIDVDECRSDLLERVKDEAVPPGNDAPRQRTMCCAVDDSEEELRVWPDP